MLIIYIAACHIHIFECNAKICKGKGQSGRNVWRYLDTSDAKSSSNLRWHAKICWGEEAVEVASQTKDVHMAWDAYSHRQHTKTESQYVPNKTLLSFSTLFLIAWRLCDGFLKARVPSALSKIEAFNPWWRLVDLNTTYLHQKLFPEMWKKFLFVVMRESRKCCRWVTSTYYTAWLCVKNRLTRNMMGHWILPLMPGHHQTIKPMSLSQSTSKKVAFRFQCSLISLKLLDHTWG